LAGGDLVTVGLAAKAASEAGERVLIFEDGGARLRDLDLRGPEEEVRARLAADAPAAPVKRGPGRPKLGVSAREVTLLPRHWDWLAAQPGGASATLRRLVEEARKSGGGAMRIRQGREAAYRFITAMAGDRPGYEEATRALFAGDGARFTAETQGWPKDVREHAWALAGEGLS
jgi:hypothetical protein